MSAAKTRSGCSGPTERRDAERPGGAMRGVFEPADAWIPTENLFRRDADGDYWLIDHKNTVISTLRGPCITQPIVDAVGDLDQVDSAVVYGVHVRRSVTIRPREDSQRWRSAPYRCSRKR